MERSNNFTRNRCGKDYDSDRGNRHERRENDLEQFKTFQNHNDQINDMKYRLSCSEDFAKNGELPEKYNIESPKKSVQFHRISTSDPILDAPLEEPKHRQTESIPDDQKMTSEDCLATIKNNLMKKYRGVLISCGFHEFDVLVTLGQCNCDLVKAYEILSEKFRMVYRFKPIIKSSKAPITRDI